MQYFAILQKVTIVWEGGSVLMSFFVLTKEMVKIFRNVGSSVPGYVTRHPGRMYYFYYCQ